MAAQRLTKHYQKPWQLLVSVCLSRTNTITKDLSDIEKRYARLIDQMETENSVYNNYEMRKQELQNVVSTATDRNKKLSEKDEEKISDASRLLANIQVFYLKFYFSFFIFHVIKMYIFHSNRFYSILKLTKSFFVVEFNLSLCVCIFRNKKILFSNCFIQSFLFYLFLFVFVFSGPRRYVGYRRFETSNLTKRYSV